MQNNSSGETSQLLNRIREKGGYIRSADLEEGLSPVLLRQLHREGALVKIKNGLYRLPHIDSRVSGLPIDFVDLALALPDGIICLTSALAFFKLSDYPISPVTVAVPHNRRLPRIYDPEVQIFFFRERFYGAGIEELSTPFGDIRIYSREKSLCDLFRYRNRFGENHALEALKRYIQWEGADFSRLLRFADECQVKTILRPLIKALVWTL